MAFDKDNQQITDVRGASLSPLCSRPLRLRIGTSAGEGMAGVNQKKGQKGTSRLFSWRALARRGADTS